MYLGRVLLYSINRSVSNVLFLNQNKLRFGFYDKQMMQGPLGLFLCLLLRERERGHTRL